MTYSAMGAVGFLYESMKDQLRWHNLKPKKHIEYISTIGKYISMSDKDFAKANREKQSTDDIAAMLIAAFGDGT